MEKILKYILTFILGGMIVFFVAKQCEDSPDVSLFEQHKAEKEKYQSDVQKLSLSIIQQNNVIDSLKKIPPKIIIRIDREIANTDSIIAKDSTKSIPELRTSLALWGVSSDIAEYPTYREFGYAAKYLRKGYGFGLQIDYLYDIINEQDSLIGNQKSVIRIKNNIADIDNFTIDGLSQLVIDVKPKWWQSPVAIIVYIGLTFITGIMVAL